NRHGIDAAVQGAIVGERLGPGLLRSLGSALRKHVDGGDEHGVGPAGQQSRMMPAKVADANDRHACWRGAHDALRPTIVMPASSAAAMTASWLSSTSVRPASIDSPSAPASRIVRIVARP